MFSQDWFVRAVIGGFIIASISPFVKQMGPRAAIFMMVPALTFASLLFVNHDLGSDAASAAAWKGLLYVPAVAVYLAFVGLAIKHWSAGIVFPFSLVVWVACALAVEYISLPWVQTVLSMAGLGTLLRFMRLPWLQYTVVGLTVAILALEFNTYGYGVVVASVVGLEAMMVLAIAKEGIRQPAKPTTRKAQPSTSP